MATQDTFVPTESDNEIETLNSDRNALEGLMDNIFKSETTKEEAPKSSESAAPTNEIGESSEPVKTEATPQPEVTQEAPKQEPTGEVKVEGTPITQAAKTEGTEEPDVEIDAIPMPAGLNPNNQDNWKRLRQTTKEYKSAARQAEEARAQAEQKLAEMQAKLQGVPDTKEIEELRKFRRMFDIKADAEFAAKFDGQIDKGDNEIYDLLKARGLSEENLKAIKANGGVGSYPFKWWKENILQKLEETEDVADSRAAVILESKLKARDALIFDKEQAIKEASDSGSKYMQDRLARQKFMEDYEMKVVNERVGQLQKEMPWLRVQEIPLNATPQQKAELEKANKFYQDTEKRFLAALYPDSPEVKVETAVAACLSFKLMDDLEAVKAQLKVVSAENEKLKNAGKTSTAGRAATIAPTNTNKAQSRLKMNDSDAMEALMNEVMSGSKS